MFSFRLQLKREMASTGTLEILLVEAQGLKDRDKCILGNCVYIYAPFIIIIILYVYMYVCMYVYLLAGCLNVINPWKRVSKPYAHIVYGNQEHTSSVGKGTYVRLPFPN